MKGFPAQESVLVLPVWQHQLARKNFRCKNSLHGPFGKRLLKIFGILLTSTELDGGLSNKRSSMQSWMKTWEAICLTHCHPAQKIQAARMFMKKKTKRGRAMTISTKKTSG